MMAVIKTGGKQYLVKEGDVLQVEKLDAKEQETINFEEVLMTGAEDGSSAKIGSPLVDGATVTAKIIKQGRARKVMVKKFKAKVRYARTYGHRQPYTELQITKISA
ncbi:MAG: 50S ribosomal protein L21 [Candidatus Kerfeldbacteria bacterium]|nr:50S ribosomal protein L21 [Candidatus Kerfeldbacteria bacterium]